MITDSEGESAAGWPASRRRLVPFLWFAVLVAAAVEVVAAFRRPPWDHLPDLHVYYGSIRALFSDGSLYGFTAENGDPFTYPPFAGLVLAPLNLVPEYVAGMIWTVALIATIVSAAWVVARNRPDLRTSSARFMTPTIALLLLVSAPVASNIRFGQISWFLVVLVGLDALSLVGPRYRGVATGVAAAIKLTPLVFIPYYWFAGRRRDAVTATGTFAACTGLAWLLLPRDSARFWFDAVVRTSRIGDLADGGNQSVNGILLRLELPDDSRIALQVLISALIVVIALRRAARAARTGSPIVGAAIAGTAGICVSPVSWNHHQVWILLALAASFSEARVTHAWRVATPAVMTLPIGSWLSNAAPLMSPIGHNLRGLLAVAIAVGLPFAQVGPLRRRADENSSGEYGRGGRPMPQGRLRHGLTRPSGVSPGSQVTLSSR
ncbi:glycosyltransferase 87 family protein [Catellatospora tritici]|uniref:glycosyltransferase 87 family protein n=1 Tax=Catellatospora tritici TaxID=2851566 RepID=UPI001C2D271D|nr:glycosyltransferase 87 family protein [Catellatospora tritici]MBV1850114.1 DUF2029 domain-containing protein [Catellatospora tritici]